MWNNRLSGYEIRSPENLMTEDTQQVGLRCEGEKLAGLFNKNFEPYAAGASPEGKAAAPKV